LGFWFLKILPELVGRAIDALKCFQRDPAINDQNRGFGIPPRAPNDWPSENKYDVP